MKFLEGNLGEQFFKLGVDKYFPDGIQKAQVIKKFKRILSIF